MRMQLSCGCCGPDNCLTLWTPNRPAEDVCDWFVHIEGSLTPTWPGASWSGVRRPASGGAVPDYMMDQCGFRNTATIAATSADDVPWSTSYAVNHSAAFNMTLPNLNSWPESRFPGCAVEKQTPGGQQYGPDANAFGAYIPPATRTKTFDAMVWKMPLEFDTMEEVDVASGPDGDGALYPVQVFYNSYLGKGPLEPRGTDRHLACCAVPGQVRGLMENWPDVGETWSGFPNNPAGYMGSLTGRPQNIAEINETTATARLTVGYQKRGEFSDGVVSAFLEDLKLYSMLRYENGGYAATGWTINSTDQNAVSGATCGYDPIMTTGFGGLHYDGYYDQVYEHYIGRAWHAGGHPWPKLTAEALMSALGGTYDDTKAYALAVRSFVNPDLEGGYSFTWPQCGEVRPDEITDPFSYYIYAGAGELRNASLRMVVEADFDFIYAGTMENHWLYETPHRGQTIGFRDAAPDPADWKRREEFTFPLTDDFSTVAGVMAALAATRNECLI